MARILAFMVMDMVKVLACLVWILAKVHLALRHRVQRSPKVPVHLMASLSRVDLMTALDVGREFTLLRKSWPLEGYVLPVLILQ
jgi:hypothetical protein